MAGQKEKATHQDSTEFEGPVNTGDPHAKRPRDKKQGDMEPDTSVSSMDPGKIFDSGKVAEQIEALFADVPNLSEDFSMKATVILEGALSERTEIIRKQLQEEFDAKVETSVNEALEDYVDKIDSYLSYVVEQFMSENEIAIERGIKNELAEQILNSMVSIVEANGITVPEDKIDIAEALTEEMVELENQLNEQIEANIELTKANRKYQIQEAFREVAEGMSAGAKDKLAQLAENIHYVDVDDYKERLGILKESFTESKRSTKTMINEQLDQPLDEPAKQKQIDERMKAYLDASRF